MCDMVAIWIKLLQIGRYRAYLGTLKDTLMLKYTGLRILNVNFVNTMYNIIFDQ